MSFRKDRLLQINQQAAADRKHHLLVVDDEEANLRLMQRLLERDYFIQTATDGDLALELVQKLPPGQTFHLILTDQRMARMQGSEFLEKSLPYLPFAKRIVLTGYADIQVILDSVNRGQVYQFLLKPFDQSDLLVSIQRALEAYELEVEAHRLNQELTTLNTNLEALVEERTKEIRHKGEIIDRQSIELRQLLHVLCHDLANPISAVLGCLELSKEQPEFFARMEGHMQEVLHNALSLIRVSRQFREMEEGSPSLVLQEHGLEDLVQEALQLVEQKLGEKSIQVELDLPPQLRVKVERACFTNSILANLLTNAIKFSFPASKIRLGARPEGGMLRLELCDQGMGMSPKLLEDLFSLDKPTSRPGTGGELGTGFGMPLVKKFIQAMQGRIEVQSTEKQPHSTEHGTQVRLYLPLA